MIRSLRLLAGLLTRCFPSRRDLLLENLALRQQLALLTEKRSHPRYAAPDRLFWVILRRVWTGLKQVVILVQPEPVVAGSIKGDVKKKHFARAARGRYFSDIQPLLAAAAQFARARTSFSLFWEVFCVIFLSHSSWRLLLRLQAADWQMPTMVLSETRGLWLSWVVRGGIRWRLRLIA